MPRQIIGLAGYAGSGKTSVAHMLERKGYERLAFADTLKQAAKLIYDLTHDQIYGDAKSKVDERYGLTPRFILQHLGTEVARQIHPETWIKAVERKLQSYPYDKFVIDDTRFPNEVEAIHRWGGEVWLIHRPGVLQEQSWRKLLSDHASERPYDLTYDRLLINDRDLEWLSLEVESASSGT